MDLQFYEYLEEKFRDVKDDIQDDIRDLKKTLNEHIAKDEQYWKKIDVQEGQIDLLRWLFGGLVTTLIGSGFAFLITHIKG